MYSVLALFFIGLTLLSFATTLLAWREVRKGKAHIDTVRDLTGIIDRDEITRLFGPPDDELQFAVTPDQLRQARTPLGLLSSCEWMDALLIISLTYSLMLGEGPRGWGVVAIASLYNLAGYGIPMILIYLYRRQLAQEI